MSRNNPEAVRLGYMTKCMVVWSVLIVAIGRPTRPIRHDLEKSRNSMMFRPQNTSRIDPKVFTLMQSYPLRSMLTSKAVWSVIVLAIGRQTRPISFE